MILIINREMKIPVSEYNIGTTYDRASENRLFVIPRFSTGGVDLANLTFTLDLEYANGGVDAEILTKEVMDDVINLVWLVTAGQLQVPGTAFIQIRATDDYGRVKWTSYKGHVYINTAIDTPGHYTGDLSELEYFETQYDDIAAAEALREQAEEIRETVWDEIYTWYQDAVTSLDADVASNLQYQITQEKGKTVQNTADIAQLRTDVDNIIAGVSEVIEVTFLSTGWTLSDGAYTQTVTDADITADDYMLLKDLDFSSTAAQRTAYNKAYAILAAGVMSTAAGSVTAKVDSLPETTITVGIRR